MCRCSPTEDADSPHHLHVCTHARLRDEGGCPDWSPPVLETHGAGGKGTHLFRCPHPAACCIVLTAQCLTRNSALPAHGAGSPSL